MLLITEHPANPERINAYRQKLSPKDQQKSALAKQIWDYCKTLNLPHNQTFTAINLAKSKLEHDNQSIETLIQIGCSAARTIALAGINVKIRNTRQLYSALINGAGQ